MEGGDGAPRLLDASRTSPKDVILDEGIDLVAECGRFISDRFEDARTATPPPIWTDPVEPNYEGITMAVDDPRGMRQEGPGQFHTDNRLGSTRVIKQPKGGDGTEWEWNKTEYEIPQQRVVDGVENFFPGFTNNVRVMMRNGDLTLRTTTGDFSGRPPKVEDINYFHANKGNKDKVKTALKEATTYLSPADHPLRAPVVA
ncbi:hypothetical protein HY024_05075 [Candidatus Curtissbacteria bacterium]|nr:hypothetical protein [Candidatus Curtissbacteria bacterium]